MSERNSADVTRALEGAPGTALRRFWGALRQLTGDDAYERYLEHHRRAHPDAPPLDRRAFWRSEVERRWNGGPCRCC